VCALDTCVVSTVMKGMPLLTSINLLSSKYKLDRYKFDRVTRYYYYYCYYYYYNYDYYDYYDYNYDYDYYDYYYYRLSIVLPTQCDTVNKQLELEGNRGQTMCCEIEKVLIAEQRTFSPGIIACIIECSNQHATSAKPEYRWLITPFMSAKTHVTATDPASCVELGHLQPCHRSKHPPAYSEGHMIRRLLQFKTQSPLVCCLAGATAAASAMKTL
jgi:hypothetical protein